MALILVLLMALSFHSYRLFKINSNWPSRDYIIFLTKIIFCAVSTKHAKVISTCESPSSAQRGLMGKRRDCAAQ